MNANPVQEQKEKWTPQMLLHEAAQQESPKCLEWQIRLGADINATTYSGYCTNMSLLHFSARNSQSVECLKWLLEHGADPFVRNSAGETCLYFAAVYGNPEGMMALLDSPAGDTLISIPTTVNSFPLHACLQYGNRMSQCVREMVRRGADIGLHNKFAHSAVHMAVKYRWSWDIIKLLILQGRNLDLDRGSRLSPDHHLNILMEDLMFAVRRSQEVRSWRPSDPTPSYSKEMLAVFLLQMGACPRNLKSLLWQELNREEPEGPVLKTLMDSFAYLPSPSQLKQSLFSSSESRLLQSGYQRLNPTDQAVAALSNDVISAHDYGDHNNWSPHFRSSSNEVQRMIMLYSRQSRRSVTRHPLYKYSGSQVTKDKQTMYCQRRMEVPSLRHLSRSCVRQALGANMREVMSLHIPKPLKEIILLDYQLWQREERTVGLSECHQMSQNQSDSYISECKRALVSCTCM